MLFVDVHYPQRVGMYLENFSQKKQYLWNFSCPYCGDMSKGKKKKRGFFYQHKNALNYKCHHCGVSISLGTFLEQQFPDIYKEYVLERYKESTSINTPHASEKEVKKQYNFCKVDNDGIKVDPILYGLRSCVGLKERNSVNLWLNKRHIPECKRHLLYYTTKFKKYINTIKPGEFQSEDSDHTRIVIPYKDETGKVVALAGRALKNEKPKYYMIKIDEDAERIFGLERVDVTKPIFVVEGAIDALFLPNCIAISGASYNTPFLEQYKEKIIIVPDKEPRNREVVRLLESAIKSGFKVSLLPEVPNEKDINDMVVAGKTRKDILQLIQQHITSGLKGALDFSYWCKVEKK